MNGHSPTNTPVGRVSSRADLPPLADPHPLPHNNTLNLDSNLRHLASRVTYPLCLDRAIPFSALGRRWQRRMRCLFGMTRFVFRNKLHQNCAFSAPFAGGVSTKPASSNGFLPPVQVLVQFFPSGPRPVPTRSAPVVRHTPPTTRHPSPSPPRSGRGQGEVSNVFSQPSTLH